ncbi:unnamed protein product [Gulo gulo]|uniref:Uncharacterized protein n=1 Tax=Gulo gulo TaxID=48420 RepID=A0A9X9MCM5_GULGU|nr:unnamed protein product [Gulo gulo]
MNENWPSWMEFLQEYPTVISQRLESSVRILV